MSCRVSRLIDIVKKKLRCLVVVEYLFQMARQIGSKTRPLDRRWLAELVCTTLEQMHDDHHRFVSWVMLVFNL